MLPEITVTEFGQKLKSKDTFILLDVREPDELTRAKISDARLEACPLSLIARQGTAALSESARAGNIPVYVLCHHGVRSLQVTTWLTQQGFTHIINISGGIDEYACKVDSSVGFY